MVENTKTYKALSNGLVKMKMIDVKEEIKVGEEKIIHQASSVKMTTPERTVADHEGSLTVVNSFGEEGSLIQYRTAWGNSSMLITSVCDEKGHSLKIDSAIDPGLLSATVIVAGRHYNDRLELGGFLSSQSTKKEKDAFWAAISETREMLEKGEQKQLRRDKKTRTLLSMHPKTCQSVQPKGKSRREYCLICAFDFLEVVNRH